MQCSADIMPQTAKKTHKEGQVPVLAFLNGEITRNTRQSLTESTKSLESLLTTLEREMSCLGDVLTGGASRLDLFRQNNDKLILRSLENTAV